MSDRDNIKCDKLEFKADISVKLSHVIVYVNANADGFVTYSGE